jgi:hypothetical protein
MLFIFVGFISNSSGHCQSRMLQEFGRHENHRLGVARPTPELRLGFIAALS